MLPMAAVQPASMGSMGFVTADDDDLAAVEPYCLVPFAEGSL